MNLIILTEHDYLGESRYRVVDERASHIREILRAEVGDIINVGLLNGPAGQARVNELNAESVALDCGPLVEIPPPLVEVDIVCALPRPQTLKRVLLTAAMMNVRRLYLIRANRVEKSFFQSPLLQPENQRRFLIEGLSQGKKTRLPIVSVHSRFRRFFEDELESFHNDRENAIRVLPSLETHDSIREVLFETATSLIVAVGPEGGWVPFEEELMTSRGFRPIRLGPWTLRVEHAVTATLAQIELVCGRH